MKKSILFLTGMTALLLSFGLILTACDNGSGSDDHAPDSKFDDTTLAKTKWVTEKKDEPFPFDEELKMDMKITLEFTSDTAGTVNVEITKRIGKWDAETKDKAKGMMEGKNDLTYTYKPDDTTGSYTYTRTEKDPMRGDEEVKTIEGTFTADVDKKILTTTEVDGEKTETTEYKLK